VGSLQRVGDLARNRQHVSEWHIAGAIDMLVPPAPMAVMTS
jgi:hypothetical protein